MPSYVQSLFVQTKDTDPDLRFMALNDLAKEAITNPVSFGSTDTQKEYSRILLKCLDDEMPEVRTEALKDLAAVTPCLGTHVVQALKKLSSQKSDSTSITSSIYTMAIHNILGNLRVHSDSQQPKSSSYLDTQGISESERLSIIRILLINTVEVNEKKVLFSTIDYIEIITDLLEYLGSYFSKAQIESVSSLLMELCYYADSVIGKRSIIALGILAKSVDENQMNKIISEIIRLENADDLKQRAIKAKSISLSIVIQLLKSNSYLMSSQTSKVFSSIILPGFKLDSIDDVDEDFDVQQSIEEIRSEAFNALITCIECTDKAAIDPYVENALDIATRFMKYNPYGAEEDERMDGDDESDGEDDDQEEDDYEMSDVDEDEDDEEDEDASGLSWKLRRDSTKLVSSILETFPLHLLEIYNKSFVLINQLIKDENSHVISESLKALTKIFRFTSIEGPYYSLKFLQSLNQNSNVNGNAAHRSSDVSMMVVDDPLVILNSKTDFVCNNIIDNLMLNDKKSPKKYLNLLFDFISELSKSTKGFEYQDTNWTSIFIETIYKLRDDNVNGSLSVSNHSVFSSSIRYGDLVKFYFKMIERNFLSNFGDFLKYMLKDIISIMNNSSNHEIILEGINLLNLIILKNDTEISNKDLTESYILDSLTDKATSVKYSTEIRQQSLVTLVNYILNVKLPDSSKIQEILNILIDSIKIEFLVHTDLEIINKIFKSSDKLELNNLTSEITQSWIESILTHIVEFLTIAELRESSQASLNSILKCDFVFSKKLITNELKLRLLKPLLVLPSGSISVFEDIIQLTTNEKIPQDTLIDLVDKYYEFSKECTISTTLLNSFVKNLLNNMDKESLVNLITTRASNSSSTSSGENKNKKEISSFKILANIRIQSNDSSVNLDNVLSQISNAPSSSWDTQDLFYSIVLLEQISETCSDSGYKVDVNLQPFFEILNNLKDNVGSDKGKVEEIRKILVNSISTLVYNDLDRLLPELMSELNKIDTNTTTTSVSTVASSDNRRFLLLQSLNQIFQIGNGVNISFERSKNIFENLLRVQKTIYSPTAEDLIGSQVKIDEFECNLVSEILGNLIKSSTKSTDNDSDDSNDNNGIKFLEILIEELSNISNESVIYKYTIGSIVKHLFEEKDNENSYNNNNKFLNEINLNLSFNSSSNSNIKILISYFKLSTITDCYIFNEDLLILKELGISNILFVLNKNPILAIPIITEVLPLILESEFDVKKKFITNFNIGINKYSIDNGINYRKSIYELIYSLLVALETNPSYLFLTNGDGNGGIDWQKMVYKFLKRSFKDDYHIVSICLLILIKIIHLARNTLFIETGNTAVEVVEVNEAEETEKQKRKREEDSLSLLGLLMFTMNKLLKKKLKESATRQETETKNELNKSILRFIYKMNLMIEESSSGASGFEGLKDDGGLKINNHDDLLKWKTEFYPSLLDKYSGFFNSDEKD